MEGERLQKHRCKVCRKSFPSGRSLGGHMRSHFHTAVPGSSENNAEERPAPSIRGAIYGLRKKPKKTWRMSDYTSDDGEKQCRECGKAFPSWRALFGHMRCHSERACRASAEQEQEGSWSNGWQSESEATEVAVPRRRRGSGRMLAAIAASSSSVSEYEKEEEDGAISLMMLSRDVRCSSGGVGGGIHSFTESSDKNSGVFEGRGIGEGDGNVVPRNGGCWRNGFKRVESDASDDWFVKDNEFKKPKLCNSDADELQDSDEDSKKDTSETKGPNSAATELGLNQPRFDGSEFQIEKQRFDVSDAKFGVDSIERSGWFDASDGHFDKVPERRSRFECTTCNKTFHSYQALGGHRASHKRMKGCYGSENSLETDASVDPVAVEEMVDQGVGIEATNGSSKKAKGHECLLCGKVFSSGQALGGHKRAHLVMNTDDRGDAACRQTVVIQQQPLEMPDLLDLNLPAPVNEEFNSANTNGNAEMKSWWAGSNLKHEPLVGVISN